MLVVNYLRRDIKNRLEITGRFPSLPAIVVETF
jgi:hypothetical protein